MREDSTLTTPSTQKEFIYFHTLPPTITCTTFRSVTSHYKMSLWGPSSGQKSKIIKVLFRWELHGEHEICWAKRKVCKLQIMVQRCAIRSETQAALALLGQLSSCWAHMICVHLRYLLQNLLNPLACTVICAVDASSETLPLTSFHLTCCTLRQSRSVEFCAGQPGLIKIQTKRNNFDLIRCSPIPHLVLQAGWRSDQRSWWYHKAKVAGLLKPEVPQKVKIA